LVINDHEDNQAQEQPRRDHPRRPSDSQRATNSVLRQPSAPTFEQGRPELSQPAIGLHHSTQQSNAPSRFDWKGNSSAAELRRRTQNFQLVEAIDARPGGWRSFVNMPVASEYLPNTYRREQMRGLHWFSAAARFANESQLISTRDSTGMGGAPFEMGLHDCAAEWLDRIYAEGLSRLTGGATLQQLKLSEVALTNLSGYGSNSPDPVFLGTILAQLYQAGEVAALGRPFQHGNTASSGSR
jgi:hypothetical protein